MWGMSAVSEADRLDRVQTLKVLRRAFVMARAQRRLFLSALGFVLVGTLVTLAGPTLVRYGIDHGIRTKNGSALNRTVALYVLVVIVGYITARMQFIAINRAGEGFLRELRITVFGKLQKQSMAFFDREKAGVLVSRMTADIESMSELVQFGLLQFVSAFLLLILATVLLAVLSWQLLIVAMVVLPVERSPMISSR